MLLFFLNQLDTTVAGNDRQGFLQFESKWGEEAKSLGSVSIESLQTGQSVTASSSHWDKLVRAKITRVIP